MVVGQHDVSQICFPFKGLTLQLVWESIRCPSESGHLASNPCSAESARAVTGRRCPHSGEGEDFLTGQPDFFTKPAVTPERKVKKSIPRWEINRHAEG